jgi:hypothetical protein
MGSACSTDAGDVDAIFDSGCEEIFILPTPLQPSISTKVCDIKPHKWGADQREYFLLGAFAKLRKESIRFVMSVCPSA